MLSRVTNSIIIAQGILFVFAVMSLAGGSAVWRHAAIGAPFFPEPPSPAAWVTSRAESRSNRTPKAGERPVRVTPQFQNLPSHVFLEVPFVPQAPFGDWSQPYKDACEETSVAMAMAWVRSQESLDPSKANEEILGQAAYELFNFGYHRDTDLAQTLKLFTRYYGYSGVSAVYDITIPDIKSELASGNLVILPVAGALLPNPYYASPPPYHMVVVIGFDDTAGEFIVNDPGTRRGQNYRYAFTTLWNAIHDWTGSEDTLLEGAKGMIVVWPEGRRP